MNMILVEFAAVEVKMTKGLEDVKYMCIHTVSNTLGHFKFV